MTVIFSVRLAEEQVPVGFDFFVLFLCVQSRLGLISLLLGCFFQVSNKGCQRYANQSRLLSVTRKYKNLKEVIILKASISLDQRSEFALANNNHILSLSG